MDEYSSGDEKVVLAETFDQRKLRREEFEAAIRVPSATFLDALTEYNIARREFIDFMEKELKKDEREEKLYYAHTPHDLRLFQLLDAMIQPKVTESGHPKLWKTIQKCKKIAFMTIDELIAKIKGDLPLNKFKYKAELMHRLEKLSEEEMTYDLAEKILKALDHHRTDTTVGSFASMVVPVVGASLFPVFELEEIERLLHSKGVRNISLLTCMSKLQINFARYEYVVKAVRNIAERNPQNYVMSRSYVDPSLVLMSEIDKDADASRVYALLHPNGPQGDSTVGRQLLCARSAEGLSCVEFVRRKQAAAKQQGDSLYQAIYPAFDPYKGILNEFLKFIRDQLLDTTVYVMSNGSDVRQLLEILNEFSPAEIKEVLSAASSHGSVRSVIFRLRIHNIDFSDLENVSAVANEMSVDAELTLKLESFDSKFVEVAVNAGLNLRNPRIAQWIMQNVDTREHFIDDVVRTFGLMPLDPISKFADCIIKNDIKTARQLIEDKKVNAENIHTLVAGETVFHLVVIYNRPEMAVLLHTAFGKVRVKDAREKMPEAYIRHEKHDEQKTHKDIVKIYEKEFSYGQWVNGHPDVTEFDEPQRVEPHTPLREANFRHGLRQEDGRADDQIDPVTTLAKCIMQNDIATAEALIREEKITAENVTTLFAGVTVFHLVVIYNRPEIAMQLYKKFGKVRVADEQGRMPETYLRLDASDKRKTDERIVNIYNGTYELDPLTALVNCIKENDIKEAEALIQTGKINFENVSTLFAGTTVFHLVIFYNRPEIATLLHRYFGLGRVKDENGQLPEHCINLEAQDERRTHEKIVRIYADKLIFGAVICRRLEMLYHLLMDLHCDANATPNPGTWPTALDLLLERANEFSADELEAFAKVLVLNGAHVKYSNVENCPDELRTFLQQSYNTQNGIKNIEVVYPRNQNIRLALIFNNMPDVEYYVDKNGCDQLVDEVPVIFIVARYLEMTHSVDAFKYFLEKGVNMNVTDKEGVTLQARMVDIFKHLFKKYVDINPTEKRGKALQADFIDAFKCFLAKSVNIDVPDKDGITLQARIEACNSPKLTALLKEHKEKLGWKSPREVSVAVASQHGSPVASPVVSPRTLARIHQQVEELERRTDEVEAHVTILDSLWRKVDEAEARTAALEEQLGLTSLRK